MHWIVLFLVLAVGMSAQSSQTSQIEIEGDAESKPKPVSEEAAKRAQELLEQAVEMSGGVQPEVSAAALMHLGENFASDRARARELLEKAFEATNGIPPGPVKRQLQAEVVRTAGRVDAALAIGMIKRMEYPQARERDMREMASLGAVQKLLGADKVGEVFELVEFLGSTGEYPYNLAQSLLKKLDPNDERNVTVLSSAIRAYTAKPTGRGFPELLGRYSERMPQAMLDSSARGIVNAILDRSDEETFASTISSQKGSASFQSRKDMELFDVMHILQKVDPKRAEEVLGKRPDLKAMLDRFPEGRRSMTDGDKNNILNTSTMTGRKGESFNSAEMQMEAQSEALSARALEAWRKGEKEQALSLVEQIPLPIRKTQAYVEYARIIAAKEPKEAKSVLTRAEKTAAEIKQPGQRFGLLVAMVDGAAKAQDREMAWGFVKQAQAAAADAYREDTNPEDPNTAMREWWPSTQFYRRLVHQTATHYGTDAEAIVSEIKDPEINLLVRIEYAQALLGRPRTSDSIQINRQGRR